METSSLSPRPPPPPSASAFLQKHTHHADNNVEESNLIASPRATHIMSNFIGGLVGGAATPAGDESAPSMKHRKESPRSYEERLPKSYKNEGGDVSSSIPWRGFGSGVSESNPGPETSVRPAPFANLKHRFRGLFSPRATDMQILIVKLQNQFHMLEIDHEKYALEQGGSTFEVWDEGAQIIVASKESRKDPKHPLNNPNIMTEVHFVGRKALDSSIIELSTLLINHDKFGSITELWLNDNVISDDGAAAISSYLQLPSCTLVELWLGNNQIGPTGTTLISGALSNNENSKLKCLGLYLNPIGNGGASSISQMLRLNHTLSTVDVHGCGNRGKGQTVVMEGYGSKVIKAADGTEYVARVVASIADEKEGLVTDNRFLDAIQTFVAFNRINPTREQVIRGVMASKKQIEDNASEEHHQNYVSKFLSGLCNQPPHEQLTDEEKWTWKDCEWKRLHVERERARTAKAALANTLIPSFDENEGNASIGEFTIDDEEEDQDQSNTDSLVEDDNDSITKEKESIGQDLDDEVVRTDTRSWRDLKMGITGSTRTRPRRKQSPTKGQRLHVILDVENEGEN